MFWGMNLKPNRKYTQTTSKSFHISQAVLDTDNLAEGGSNKIYISGEDNEKFLICTLRKNFCEQVMLDLNFAEGDTISFQSVGNGNVTLSGYLILDSPDEFGDDDEEDESSDLENPLELPNGSVSKKAKPKQADEEEDSDEDDDEDMDAEDALLKAALEGKVNEDEDEDDDESEEEDDDDEEEEDSDEDEDEEDDSNEEIEEPKKKIAKVEKKEAKPQKQEQQQQPQNGTAQKSKKEQKAEKKQQQKEKQQQQQSQQKQQQQQQKPAAGERSLTGGVKIEDIRVGNGPEAKTGKRVQVYYEGRLKSNNKVFDSLRNGAPFKFGIGRGEVIKAWDVGVSGMKVGGKRRITCPPHMAYGARGSPPAIPPNSTLIFEVELKGVN